MEILDEDEAAWDDKAIENGAPENISLDKEKDLVTQENNTILLNNIVKEEIIVASTSSQKETQQNLEIEPTKDKSSILAWLQLSTSTSTEQEDFTPYKPLFDSPDKETQEAEPGIEAEAVNGNSMICCSSEQENTKKDETVPSSEQRVENADKKTFIEPENTDHDTSSAINSIEINEGLNKVTKSDIEQKLELATSVTVIESSNENKSTKSPLRLAWSIKQVLFFS